MNLWKINLAKEKFELIEKCSADYWHDGPFRYNNHGLTEQGAPKELENYILKLDEVKDVHAGLMNENPNSFFETDSYTWYYTGKTGEAPDNLGFHPKNGLSICEIKWKKGWESSLPNQIYKYAKMANSSNLIPLHLRIASAQGGMKKNESNFIEIKKKLLTKNWLSVNIHLGQFYIGWDNSNNYYLKLKWIDKI